MKIPVPKMILQPIIENAVKHGLEPLDRPGKLRIHIESETAKMLMIRIVDNGVGMKETTLQSLLENR